MFENRKIEFQIKALEDYMKLNDILYQNEDIKRIIDEFEKDYHEKHIKHLAKVKGYELFTDQYIFVKRVELIRQLIADNFGLVDWQRALKVYLMSNYKFKNVFIAAGMTMGADKTMLSPSEIVINETSCKKMLNNLKTRKSIDDLLNNTRR